MADDIQSQVNAWFAAPENANATPAQVAATSLANVFQPVTT